MTGRSNDPDGKGESFNQLRIRRAKKKRPIAELPQTGTSGILTSIGKRLRSELNANTTPMPLRILLVALRLMPPEKPAGEPPPPTVADATQKRPL